MQFVRDKMSWLMSGFTDVVNDLINGILDFTSGFANDIFFTIAEINLENSMIINAATYTTLLGIAMISLIGVKQYFTTYVMETSGDPDSDPLDILVRCSEAIAVCSCNDFIATHYFKFSKAFSSDLASSGFVGLKPVFSDLLKLAKDPAPVITIFLLVLLLILIGNVFFFFIAAIRGAELSFMKIFLPIMAVDLVTANRERWGNFFVSYTVTFLYYGIQLLCYRMFLGSLMSIAVTTLSKEMLITFGWFILMLRSPKWLDKFIYSTGLGRGIAGAGRTATFMLPNFMKMVGK